MHTQANLSIAKTTHGTASSHRHITSFQCICTYIIHADIHIHACIRTHMSTHSCRQLRAQLKSQEDAVKQLSEMLDEDKKRAAAELQVSVCLSEYACMLDKIDTLNLQVLVCLSNLRMSVCLCKYACLLDKGTKTDTAGVCPLSMSRLSVSV